MNRGIRLAQAGLLVNAVLALVKLLAGLLGNSYALVADAVESLADIFGSLVVWGGLSWSSREADPRYPFGYGKAESVSAAIVGLVLLLAAAGIAAEAVVEIRTPHHAPAPFTLAVLLAVVLVKELLFRSVLRGARDTGSVAVAADAWHHRSDAITSAFAFLGISAALLGGPGWEPADDWAALAASVIVFLNGLNIIRPAFAELMDRSPEAGVLEAVEAAVRRVPGVAATEKLKVRKSGPRYLLEMHVQADPALSLHQAHVLSGKVKSAIRLAVPSVRDVLIHMEPVESAVPAPVAAGPDHLDRFHRHLAALRLPAGPAVVAVSGGSDSLALLSLLRESPAAAALVLHVAHVDHGIHPGSAAVAETVRAEAARAGLPFHLTRLALGAGATETVARRERYRWLFRLADELGAEVIFTAHHRDDQVETVLMRFLRGSGPAGLAGIATRRGRLVRPLLPFRREELAGYLQAKGARGWEDPANLDPRNLRSWVRHDLLPSLRRQLPDVESRLLDAGRQAAQDRGAWDAILAQWPGLEMRHAAGEVSVAVTPLRGYDSVLVRVLLGALGRRAGCTIGPARAARLERMIRRGGSGAITELGAGFAAELSFGRLRLSRGPAHPPPWGPIRLEGESGEVEVGEWRVRWRREPAPERLERIGATSWFAVGQYEVRPWRAGDRIRPIRGQGGRLVVRCMQEQKVARSRRGGWPVIVHEGAVAWVPGVSRAALQVPAPGTSALRIDADLR